LFLPHLGVSLVDVLYAGGPGGGLLRQAAYAHPALFSLQYALACTWQGWGAAPAFVLGHSLGEYAAACVAGVFSLEDAVKLVAAGALLTRRLPPGALAVVRADAAEVEEALRDFAPEEVAVAARNGPRQTVIAGTAAAVREARHRLAAR